LWNLLHQHTDVCFFHNHQNEFKEYFSPWNHLLFCNDVCALMDTLGHQRDPTGWLLFTESSKVSFKVVLLHNGNKFPYVPLASAAIFFYLP
jgi:hypothetical protein